MDEKPTSDTKFDAEIDISIRISLSCDIHSSEFKAKAFQDYNNRSSISLETRINENLDELTTKGVALEEPYLSDKEANEYTYIFTSKAYNYNNSSLLESVLGLNPTDIERVFGFVVQLSSNTALGIAENKTTLDILTDFATIIGSTIPITTIIFQLLHLDKAYKKSEKVPSVSISIGEVSVTVTDDDLNDAEHAATNIARKLLKEHPEALPSTNVNISWEAYQSSCSIGTPCYP